MGMMMGWISKRDKKQYGRKAGDIGIREWKNRGDGIILTRMGEERKQEIQWNRWKSNNGERRKGDRDMKETREKKETFS
jgi:hypothetical protein